MDFSRLDRYRQLVDDWPAFRDAVQAPLPVTLWANPMRAPRRQLAEVLLADGIESSPLGWYRHGLRIAYGGRPGKTLAYITGHCHIQEEVSMLPVALLDPQPGERVLDLCAAPGNKSVQAAVHMAGRGLVMANDVNQRRLGMVTRNVERLGLGNVMVSQWDGSSLPTEVGVFDRVLADVPCSCEGTTRKNPEILWREPVKRSPVGAQTAILRKAVQRCRPGGRVVYATCTYAPEENEAVVDTVLREYAGSVRLVDAALPGFDFAPGITEWQGRVFLPELRRSLRAWPHRNDTGGFFIAVLERSPQAEDGADEGTETDDRPAARRPEDVGRVVDGRPYVEIMAERFGIPASAFEASIVLRPNRESLWIADRDLELPSRPDPYTLGMPFFHADMELPKPTTAAAIRFGPLASRNVLEVEPSEVAALLQRRDLALDASRAAAIDGHGYVLLRFRSLVLGVGLYRPSDGGGGVLRGLLPRSWTTRLGVEPPPEKPPPWIPEPPAAP